MVSGGTRRSRSVWAAVAEARAVSCSIGGRRSAAEGIVHPFGKGAATFADGLMLESLAPKNNLLYAFLHTDCPLFHGGLP